MFIGIDGGVDGHALGISETLLPSTAKEDATSSALVVLL